MTLTGSGWVRVLSGHSVLCLIYLNLTKNFWTNSYLLLFFWTKFLFFLIFWDFEFLFQGVKLSDKSNKILYFWNCPIKSYIFSKCPINPIFSTKTAIFVNSLKHFQGMGYVSQLYVRGMASALNVPSCTCRVKSQMSLEGSYRGRGAPLLIYG